MVNTPDCGSGMHGFDPHISPHFKITAYMVRKIILKFIILDIMNFFIINTIGREKYMEEIKLSQIDDSELNDEQIDNIVFSNIEDDELSSKYAFVFGNSMLINERVNTAVTAYKKRQSKKTDLYGRNEWS